MGFHDLDLSERLRIAREGTSYFAGHLSELADEQLHGATLLDGWTRRHLLAHVCYNANALGRLLDWAATGVETPMYESVEHRNREIADGAGQSSAALRDLFGDTVSRLDQKWWELPEEAWSAEVRTAQGRAVPASETVWMRTREMWIHAVDLDTAASFADFPAAVLESLLTDIVGVWRTNGLGDGLVLEVTGAAPVAVGDGPPRQTVTGPLPAVVAWAAGRGGTELPDAPPPPRWL